MLPGVSILGFLLTLSVTLEQLPIRCSEEPQENARFYKWKDDGYEGFLQ